MTFDTSELKGRAEKLKQTAIDKTVDELIKVSSSGGGIPPVGQIQDMAEKQYAGVENIYDDFLSCPRPEDFAGACQQLNSVMENLAVSGWEKDPVGGGTAAGSANSDLSGVATSGGYMADWTGDAASTYKANFADKFEGVTSNEFVTASVIRHAINAEAAVWQATCDDLDKLSADAQSRMEEVNDRSPSDWAMELTVLGAVLAVVAAPVTGGTSLEIAFAVVGAGISVAATGVGAVGSGSKDEQGLETGSPDAITPRWARRWARSRRTSAMASSSSTTR